ncbi:MAG: hypothetical protein ACYTJ0_06915 [Planctomycetota bacterium]|jgi:hypothetical protein
MSRIALLALVLSLSGVAPAMTVAAAPAPGGRTQLMFEILLIQLHPDAERTVSLKGDVLTRQVPLLADIPLIGDMFKTTEAEPFTIISADEVTIRRGEESWRPMDDPTPADAPFDVLTAPRLITGPRQDAAISVGQTVPYLEHDAGGCLVVRRCDECFEGVRIGISPGETTADRVEIQSFSVEIASVVDREPLEGVPLDVGRPVMARRHVEGAFTITPEQTMVMPVVEPAGADGSEPILLLLRVKVLP